MKGKQAQVMQDCIQMYSSTPQIGAERHRSKLRHLHSFSSQNNLLTNTASAINLETNVVLSGNTSLQQLSYREQGDCSMNGELK
jgi:low affinity Fe/Cu permease